MKCVQPTLSDIQTTRNAVQYIQQTISGGDIEDELLVSKDSYTHCLLRVYTILPLI